MERFDVIVVGARCAGSPLATLLARRGLRVCLVDRATFPSETLSTHMVQPCGVQSLERLGVLDEVWAAGAEPLTRFRMVADGLRLDAEDVDEFAGAPGLCLRREALDQVLVEAAAAAGAEVRTGLGVKGVREERGRVAGVETKDGPLHARLVVGADGRSSPVASHVGAREYHVTPPGRVFAWGYFENASYDRGVVGLGRYGDYAYLTGPVDEGLFLAAVCPPQAARDGFLADRAAGFSAGLREWPELAERLAGAERVGPLRVCANWHGYFRESAGPGWALVGDAGHFKDPSPAQGISDAFRQAERLAKAVDAGFDGGDLDRELLRWWAWRDEDAWEMYWFASDLGAPGEIPLATEIMRGVAAKEEAMVSFLRVMNHELPPSRVFTPGLGLRALGRLMRHERSELPDALGELGTAVREQVRREWLRRRRSPVAAAA